jgi:hypothetical protein
MAIHQTTWNWLSSLHYTRYTHYPKLAVGEVSDGLADFEVYRIIQVFDEHFATLKWSSKSSREMIKLADDAHTDIPA